MKITSLVLLLLYIPVWLFMLGLIAPETGKEAKKEEGEA